MTDPPLELYITETSFRPNPTTVRFARTVPVKTGDVVFDIGTGIGPLAIKAAMDGARIVLGVDPVPIHCELAHMNVAKYGLQDTVHILEGEYFDPIDHDPEFKDLKADVIIGDVSGIADRVSRALGWYSEDVPTGGEDGTDVLIPFLERARSYLAPGGAIYFPVSIDLSDSQKILRATAEIYGEVKNAMERESVSFPITEAEMQAVKDAYDGTLPSFINFQLARRPCWRGQIWRASKPR